MDVVEEEQAMIRVLAFFVILIVALRERAQDRRAGRVWSGNITSARQDQNTTIPKLLLDDDSDGDALDEDMAEADLAEADLARPIKSLNKALNVRFKDTGNPEKTGLRIGALNANSIKKAGRQDILNRRIRHYKFDIFIVLETKLIDGDTVTSPKHRSLERKDRRYKIKQSHVKTKTTSVETTKNQTHGGGILIYIHKSVNYNVKSRGEYAESNVEFLHIEITSPVKLHLVALYCPDKKLVDHLISLMSHFVDPLGKRKIMFIGDTNIDRYGGAVNDRLGNTFFDVLGQPPYGIKQLIKQITHGKACIDHIFTNMEQQQILECGVMENCITSAKKGHKGIYCTITHEAANPGNGQIQENNNNKAAQKYVFTVAKLGMLGADFDTQNWIETLMKNLSRNLNPKNAGCILAIVCKLTDEVPAPEISATGQPDLHSHCCNNEGMYCIRVNSQDDREERIELLQQAINELGVHVDNENILEKQCIIFTRNSQTKMFHDLQKKMWYRNWGWDVVWQPRHVEILGYVLEPSLTHAIRNDGEHPLRNMLQKGPLKSIELEESSYRYWSKGTFISRLTVEVDGDLEEE